MLAFSLKLLSRMISGVKRLIPDLLEGEFLGFYGYRTNPRESEKKQIDLLKLSRLPKIPKSQSGQFPKTQRSKVNSLYELTPRQAPPTYHYTTQDAHNTPLNLTISSELPSTLMNFLLAPFLSLFFFGVF